MKDFEIVEIDNDLYLRYGIIESLYDFRPSYWRIENKDCIREEFKDIIKENTFYKHTKNMHIEVDYKEHFIWDISIPSIKVNEADYALIKIEDKKKFKIDLIAYCNFKLFEYNILYENRFDEDVVKSIINTMIKLREFIECNL